MHSSAVSDRLEVEHSERGWSERSYTQTLLLADAAAALLAAAVAFAVRFGSEGGTDEPYLWLSAALPVLWILAMAGSRAYESRFFGVGSEEFRRVLTAATLVIAAVGTGSWALKYDLARGYVVLALPLATALTLLLRLAMRKRLHRLRRQGECLQRVLVVGHEQSVLSVVQQVRLAPHHGMHVVGACLPTTGQRDSLLDLRVPVVGSFDDVTRAVELTGAQAVAVLACPELDGAALRRLAWDLERTGTELLVAPALMDVAGPRIAIRPVSGLPLLHVDHPELTGGRRLTKAVLDRCVAALALLVLSPVFLAVVLLVRMTSSGPAFFLQKRVGRHGEEFDMIKFRTMCVDAEARRDALLQLNTHHEGPLFKMRRDPRVTRVGAVLRRYSLDELPQLVNVLAGSMSLVGPRPPLPQEVAVYGSDVRRRLLVKPGLTGLWQVSGRSDLPWDESVRLDLRYVENWSLALDLMIVVKTLRAVVLGTGAY